MNETTQIEHALGKISNLRKKQIVSNIARTYCLIEEQIKEKKFNAKLTNKTTVLAGQYLIEAKAARMIILKQGLSNVSKQ